MKARKYTKEVIEKLVKESTSIKQIINKLDLTESGGNYVYIKKLIKYYNLDITHFTGQRWNRGKSKKDNLSLLNQSINTRIDNNILFSENAPCWVNGAKLRDRMIEIGIDYKCKECGNIGEWNGNSLRLQVDHINGVNNDNRIENLRFLCPNCHSQTITWSKRKYLRVSGVTAAAPL